MATLSWYPGQSTETASSWMPTRIWVGLEDLAGAKPKKTAGDGRYREELANQRG